MYSFLESVDSFRLLNFLILNRSTIELAFADEQKQKLTKNKQKIKMLCSNKGLNETF